MAMKLAEAKYEVAELRKGNILGVDVAITHLEEVLTLINSKLVRFANRPFFVVTVNPEFIMQALDDEEFKQILNAADLAIPDGNTLKVAIKELEIIPGRKLVKELVEKSGKKIFYLGGRNGVAREMAEKYGGEWDEGEENIKSTAAQINSNVKILNRINKFKPDLLLVAYGAPWQEKWIHRNLDKIKAKVVMGVGGTFDVLTGRLKLPPNWVEEMRLEWLWRLIQEPSRWRRQLKVVKYLYLVWGKD